MKYMGSKRSMIKSTLGQVLDDVAPNAGRFVDLFSGSGAVSWHVAQQYKIPVCATDIQEYSRVLANSVVSRTMAIENPSELWDTWVTSSTKSALMAQFATESLALQAFHWESKTGDYVSKARIYCQENGGPLQRAYGGHYFSPYQALIFDSLRSSMPKDDPNLDTYLAALVMAAAECAAAPGHTAQPFQPTETAQPYLFEAWRRDVWTYVRRAFLDLAGRSAQVVGEAKVSDALTFARTLLQNDIAFLDPPYSGVQYSRFYHVLETVANGSSFEPEGVGRYPKIEERPHSEFSQTSRSRIAFYELTKVIADRGTKCIVTYPSGDCSNGLSGKYVLDSLNEFFTVETVDNEKKFSTMGGNGKNRDARQKVNELILVCKPR